MPIINMSRCQHGFVQASSVTILLLSVVNKKTYVRLRSPKSGQVHYIYQNVYCISALVENRYVKAQTNTEIYTVPYAATCNQGID